MSRKCETDCECGRHKPRTPAQAAALSRWHFRAPLEAISDEERARRRRSQVLKSRYGITLDEYEAKLQAQGGRCAICGTDQPRGRGAFHVDHDHATGQVRDLLCISCNADVGVYENHRARLAAYLARHGS